MLKILISFNLDEEHVERIRSCLSGIDVKKSSDPGVLLSEICDAEVLLAGRFNSEMFKAAKRLKWVQAIAAGVDRFLFGEFVSSDVVLTNARGVHPAQVSDHVLALILAFSRKLNIFKVSISTKMGPSSMRRTSGKGPWHSWPRSDWKRDCSKGKMLRYENLSRR